MTRQAVESSAVKSLGYDAETQTLEVEFHPDRYGRCAVWQYAPVSSDIYASLIDSSRSVGRTLHESVKKNAAITAVDVTPEVVH